MVAAVPFSSGMGASPPPGVSSARTSAGVVYPMTLALHAVKDHSRLRLVQGGDGAPGEVRAPRLGLTLLVHRGRLKRTLVRDEAADATLKDQGLVGAVERTRHNHVQAEELPGHLARVAELLVREDAVSEDLVNLVRVQPRSDDGGRDDQGVSLEAQDVVSAQTGHGGVLDSGHRGSDVL